ncbi:chlorophyll synthesis pathway protein BchC [Sphingomonas astaxanthinifaciens]|uniref:Chlorophyll synthesis pathway protein BchC n=1 Tax=Sphingomonas astaxanthinifaciens DSM 22298 TaxID=1123267 RepID=A0ABQ5Z6Y2_9SPHN|nr:chlorophyll synthesis pathway protein BchC [Sphingomonas astaxanthinifaciens]GLR47734.1 chlorophyll synthesis pathway protein BchC [Sphingomonas astaxanthinifaciens DSM 22298]
MDALAVIIEAPERLSLRPLELEPMGESDVLVEVAWSGISSGTEKLLWSGAMPPFPGMGYPLVPGYESVGRIVDSGSTARGRIGEWVFVPGARCYREAHGLFGGTARRVIVPAARALPIPEALGEQGILFALAATASHLLDGGDPPELIVGHGVLGRLIARLAIACGAPPPTVWETDPRRADGAVGYTVTTPEADERRDYRVIVDVTGDSGLLDTLIGRLAPQGELVLGGFYAEPIRFAFPPAFMREARLRIAAEWQPDDLAAARVLVDRGLVSLDGLITDVRPAEEATEAYPHAFTDTRCLKMVLDWRGWA